MLNYRRVYIYIYICIYIGLAGNRVPYNLITFVKQKLTIWGFTLDVEIS